MTYDFEKSRTFYNALKAQYVLNYGDEEDRKKYIAGLHGEEDSVATLKHEIELSNEQGVFLFTGQTSSGKSTELKRLHYLLESKSRSPCKVYYLDMSQWLSTERPLELGGFIVAVVAAWVEAIGTNAAQRTPAQRLADFVKDTKIQLSGINLSAGFDFIGAKTDLQVSLRSDDNFLKNLENEVKKNQVSFVKQVKQFVENLVNEICPTQEKCVLLIDSLEKIQGYGAKGVEVMDSVLTLFSQQSQALQFPLTHVVYSIAPYVLEQNKQLPALLGGAIAVQLPSVHIYKNKSVEIDKDGEERLLQLLNKRYPDWEQFISKEQVQSIIANTGGELRDYLRALQACIAQLSETQPRANEKTLEGVWRQIRPTLALEAKHLDWLGRVAQSHKSELDDGINAHVLQRFLNTKHVLAYLNGETWYGIHPLIRKAIEEHATVRAKATYGTNSAAQ